MSHPTADTHHPEEGNQTTLPSVAAKRATAALMGLAAGDRNGGPQRLAMRVAESLNAQGGWNALSLSWRYGRWIAPTHPFFTSAPDPEALARRVPAETESAYDLGAVFPRVFRGVFTFDETGNEGAADGTSTTELDAAKRTIRQAWRAFTAANGDTRGGDVAAATSPSSSAAASAFAVLSHHDFQRFNSAGVAPAHRCAPLALEPTLATRDALAEAVREEARLTHGHPEAVETAVATAVLVRELVAAPTQATDGAGLPDEEAHTERLRRLHQAIVEALKSIDVSASRDPAGIEKPLSTRLTATCELVAHVLRRCAASVAALRDEGKLDLPFVIDYGGNDVAPTLNLATYYDGHAPLVLGAALSFLATRASFRDALTASVRMAGPANFCPVLVGSIGGALFGEVPDALLDHSEFRPVPSRTRTSSLPAVPAVQTSDLRSHETRYRAAVETLVQRFASAPRHR